MLRDGIGRGTGVVDIREEQSHGELVSILSHDLREPLRTSLMGLDMIAEDLEDQGIHPPPLLDSVQTTLARMDGLLDDLLQFGMVMRDDSLPTTVELNDLLFEVVEDLAAAISETGARVEVRTSGVVTGMRHQLRLLFQNLLANALKFSRPGVQPHVSLSTGCESTGQVCVCVADNGIGIAPEHHNKVFRLFGRCDAPSGRVRRNGLWSCAVRSGRVALNHGGRIEIDSACRRPPGAGATFKVLLPH